MKSLQGLVSLMTGVVGKARRAIMASPDGEQGPPRLDRTNETIVSNLWNSMHQLAIEGSLYVAQTATPGTGITASQTNQTYSLTKGNIAVNNMDRPTSLGGQGKDIIPLWLKYIITAAGSNGTDAHYASILDYGARGAGGTQLVSSNVNPNYPMLDEVSQIFVGTLSMATLSNNAINVGRAEGRKASAPAFIVGDVITFVFGSNEQAQFQAITPTTAIGLVLNLPAVVIPPGWCWAMHDWMTGRTVAFSAEVEFGYVLR